MKLPKRITITEVIRSRYEPGQRPASWDERRSGIEVVKTTEDEAVNLFSNGGQSSPYPGWELLLTEKKELESTTPSSADGETTVAAFAWTLYGVKKNSDSTESPIAPLASKQSETEETELLEKNEAQG